MFKNIAINLTEPICSCNEESLTWNIGKNDSGSCLKIACKTCGTALCVPHSKFLAYFNLDVSYPNKKQHMAKLIVLPGGKRKT